MTNDQLAADVAELKRQMACVVKWFSSASGYNIGQCTRDLTTPPPKPRPKIEVVKVMDGRYGVRFDKWYWAGGGWYDYSYRMYSEHDARAIAAALEQSGNYPEEGR